eukprot:TRINITY_DN78103_c0_g1_i1.p1 TRINITY_DN78103_c0_g1~~TRINITY_DN78103_c0_g1_i1.p1  ORF type:complete len:315 (-),score=51.19 TRINITY_DN78103_c0_g1_i1:40-951(-)
MQMDGMPHDEDEDQDSGVPLLHEPLRVRKGCITVLGVAVIGAMLLAGLSCARPRSLTFGSPSRSIDAWEVPTLGWHRAVLNTLIRRNKSLNSTAVQQVPMGSFVSVVERDGRRVRIVYPAVGWTSAETVSGEPILMWDGPEAMGKDLLSIDVHKLRAVEKVKRVLAINSKKQKEMEMQAKLKRGVDSLIARMKSGKLQDDIKQGFSPENIERVTDKVESQVIGAVNTTAEVMKGLSKDNATYAQEAVAESSLGERGGALFGSVVNAVGTEKAANAGLEEDQAMFKKQQQRWGSKAKSQEVASK